VITTVSLKKSLAIHTDKAICLMISLKYLITIPKNYNPSGADNHLKDFLNEYIF